MLRSDICALNAIAGPENFDLNECPDDPGGYFVINGQEKVLIAQERMAGNHVYVFAKGQPSPISFLADIRSVPERGGKLLSSFQVKLFHKGQEKQVNSHLPVYASCLSSSIRLEGLSVPVFPISRRISRSGSFSVPWAYWRIVISWSIFVTTDTMAKCWKC